MGWSAGEVEERLQRAFERFLLLYARFGQFRYYGSGDSKDSRTYRGPMFWSEWDCVFRLALELEQEFPRAVHLGFELSPATLHPFDPSSGDARSEVDLAVSDLSEFAEDHETHRRFGGRAHELFIEAKYLPKGFWPLDVHKTTLGVARNAQALAARKARGRCLVAAVLVVDDDDGFGSALEAGSVTLPNDVLLLHASPSTLAQRGIQLSPAAGRPPTSQVQPDGAHAPVSPTGT